MPDLGWSEKPPEAKPCPNCNSTTLRLGKGEFVAKLRFVVCRSCGVQGPVEGDQARAIAAWNRMPRREEKEGG